MRNRSRLFISFVTGMVLSTCIAGALVLLVFNGIIPIQGLLAATAVGATVPTSPRPAPAFGPFNGCPGEGDAEDIELNRRKNRIDEAVWQPVELVALLSLTWSKGLEGRHMDQWRAQDRADVMIHNGVPVQTEGYLLQARANGPEAANCFSRTALTIGMALARSADDPPAKSLPTQIGPRIAVNHQAWTVENLQKLVQRRAPVRISGWTLFNPERPGEVGKSTASLWEIHPVTGIEVREGNSWKAWDGS